MTTASLRIPASLLCILLIAGCNDTGDASKAGRTNLATVGNSTLAQCALNSPLRQLGSDNDSPSQLNLAPADPLPRPETAALNAGDCANSQKFQIGTGVHDMTGPAGDSVSAGYETPDHVLRGIHIRQFARAFALRSPCNGKRVVMAISETAFMTQGTRQTVMDLIAADPELAPLYNSQNVVLSATHTHSGPGGEAHHSAYNLFRQGYDAYVHEIYTTALYRAIKQAHANLEAHPEPGTVRLALGELLDANSNRSEPAYARNPEAERTAWVNEAGDEVRVNKRMLQLRFDRTDGTPIGLLNWFGVHTTSVGTHEPLISSDNKGLAAITFERMLGTDYLLPDGEDRFVAGFAQSDEGDSSPNLCFRENPYPSLQIGCGMDTLESNAAHGVKQLARAIELYDVAGSPLKGGIDSRLFHVPMDSITVTDPVILESLHHPDELDHDTKRTCSAALGYSMAAGAEDNRGPSQEGITCENPDVLGVIQADIQVALDSLAAGATGQGYPTIPASTGGTVACNISSLPGLPDADYSCQAEKPVLFPIGTTEDISNSELPFQIVALGNLAVIALPWEVTTTSARRIRETVLNELRGAGVEYAVVAGLSNDFVQYLTTREEYASQQYEGASTHFGPWTLAAVQQEIRKLAISLRDGLPPPDSAAEPRTEPAFPPRAAYRPGDARPSGGDYGQVLTDADEAYSAGETVSVRFSGAHPRNDSLEKLNHSYLYVERSTGEEQWEIVSRDRDPELIMRWHSDFESPVFGQSNPRRTSEIEAIWHIPANIRSGIYRIRYEGTAVPSFDMPDSGERLEFSGVSGNFAVAGSGSACPGYPALF